MKMRLKKLVTAALLATAFVSGYNAYAQTARGTVYSDTNKNGVFDKGEKGIPGVGVSNGIDVVVTDGKGNYSIASPENSAIFVVKPTGYNLPVNKNQVPQFYYLNYPNGSPKLRYKGISPTGPLPARIDFPLSPCKEPDAFKALFFGDTQVYNEQDIAYLSEDVLAELVGSNQYVFGSVLGDIIGNSLSYFNPIAQAMSLLGVPMFYVQGNHDMDFDATEDKYASETFKAHFGPKNYAYNYGKVHFVVLDNYIYSGDSIKRNGHEGFDDESLTFLKNDLARVDTDKLIVLMVHCPFLDECNECKPIVNLDKALTILSRFPHTFSLSGHSHAMAQQLITNRYGWGRSEPHHHYNAGAACGDWWQGKIDDTGLPEATMWDGAPNGYSIVNFNGNTYTVDYKGARKPASYQMTIYSPKVKMDDKSEVWTNKELYVNFFTGSEKDTIRFRIDNGAWITMQRTIEADPLSMNYLKEWDKGCEKGRKPSGLGTELKCPHLWKAGLPDSLSNGYHKVEVQAVDLFGRNHYDSQVIRIENESCVPR